jgi:hypothetical protein
MVALALALALVAGACQVTTAVGVDANRDGSGTVRVAVGLDTAALAAVPALAADLRVDDLRRAGWRIVGPRREGDGLTWVRAAKGFRHPAQLAAVVAEVAGAGARPGLFQGFRLTTDRSLLRARTRFTGTVDLTGPAVAGLAVDPRLAQQLGDPLARRLSDALSRVVSLRIDARLPGSVSANAPVVGTGGAEWRPRLGHRVILVATGQTWDGRRLAWGAVAVAALLALVGVVVGRWWRRRLRRARGLPVTPPA